MVAGPVHTSRDWASYFYFDRESGSRIATETIDVLCGLSRPPFLALSAFILMNHVSVRYMQSKYMVYLWEKIIRNEEHPSPQTAVHRSYL